MDQLGYTSAGAPVIDISRAGKPVRVIHDIASAPRPPVQQADEEMSRLRHALAHAWEQIAELRTLADHDSLTGLANRRRLMAEIDAAIDRHRLYGRTSALILMDMDGLKPLNDRYGHQTGDDAILHVTEIIRRNIPCGGIAARIGGDEFVLLLGDTGEDDARLLGNRIARRVAETPLKCDGRSLALSISTGVAAIGTGTTAKSLLARADAAMYADKRGAA